MSVLLHLSDTHFGTEQPGVVQALLQLVRDQAPQMLVLSGDITQRARRAQFAAARAFVDAAGVTPTLTLPGNHDIPLFNLFARLFNPYGNYRRAFGSDLAPMIASDDFLVIGVNTTRWWRHTNGVVSAAQVETVAQQLRLALPRQLRLVVVHQPVHVLQSSDEHDRLRGHAHAIERWSAAGADMVLGGHIHLPYVCALHESVAGLARRLWCVQAGTAVSSRVRGQVPNSVNILRWGTPRGAECLAEQWNFDAGLQRFLLAHCVSLLPERSTNAMA